VRRALAGLVGLLLAASAFAADEPVSARAFAVKFKSLADAAEIVSPVLSPDGTMTLQPRLKTLTIQDRPAVLDRVGKLLDSFDTPPRTVDVTLSLFLGTDRRDQDPGKAPPPSSLTRDVRGVAETLSDFTKWNAYEPLGARSVSGTEGGRVTVGLSDEFRVSYDIEAVREQSVTTSAMATNATPIARHGACGANAGRSAISAMGSHLPAKVQAGRCRARVAVARTSSR
jgi:hypothetical protein